MSPYLPFCEVWGSAASSASGVQNTAPTADSFWTQWESRKRV